MANIQSSKKDIKRNAKRRFRNQSTKSALKTYIKKAKATLSESNEQLTTESVRVAIKALDKAAERNIIHKNQAARRKSRLMKAVNKSRVQTAA